MQRYINARGIRNAMGSSVAVGALAVGMVYATYLLRVDPFRSLRATTGDPAIGIVLDDVDLRDYDGAKLVSQAKIDHLSVRRDRQALTMSGIRDGVYYGRQGNVRFAADKAEWTSANQTIDVLSGAIVQATHLYLKTDRFKFDTNQSTLRVPGHIVGVVGSGHIVGSDLVYYLGDGSYTATLDNWEGKPPTAMLGQDDQARKMWHTMAPCKVSSKNGIDVYTNAQLTDGDVIVKADRIEHVQKTDVFTATGNVFYYASNANLHCDKAVVFNQEKRAVLTGAVRMLVKAKDNEKLAVEEIPPYRPVVPDEISKSRPPAPITPTPDQKQLDDELHSNKTVRKYPALVYAERIEYWYRKGERHAVITGSPQARQELTGGRWRQVWAREGLYDGEAETLRLVGTDGKSDVRVKTSLDEDGTCKWAVISTKEDDDSFDADEMMGTVSVANEDVPDHPKANQTQGGAGGKTNGGGG